jgi:cysteinyl-tRNA synthetase
MIKFLNNLSGQTEEFLPLEDNKVKLYICGPTVWNYAHIGNFRTFVFGDVLRRYLKFKGYDVTHVMNLTDVDDRIINEAKAAKKTIDEFTAPFIEAFWEDADAIGNERPDLAPRATHHIAEMIGIIEKLLENKHAYKSEGSIYYRISAFPDYGKLSKINFAGNIDGGSGRVDTDKYDKENVRDFALWKFVSEDEPTGWDASFGRGRPGWHIECSAMSMKYLGETFDIHAGGIDLQFPHHENEVAQSEGATGKLFAKTWLHSEFLKIENETMSKTLGNVLTVRDLKEKGINLKGVRYLLLSVPYRKQLNFTHEALKAAENTIERLQDFSRRVDEYKAESGLNSEVERLVLDSLQEFEAGMDDDLNTSVALAAVHNLVREVNTALANDALYEDDKTLVIDAIAKFDSVLNIFGQSEEEMLSSEIENLIVERQAARHNRNFAKSDEIRDSLAARGILLEDTKDGVRWKRK